MSIPGSAAPFLLAQPPAEGVYQIERSLRFNSSDSAYCSRSVSTAGSRTTWTLSLWVKRAAIGSQQGLFFAGVNTNGNGVAYLYFLADNTLVFNGGVNGVSTDYSLATAQVFRDAGAWMHLLAVFDTTNAVSTDRCRLFVNGARVTQFSSTTYPSLNYQGTTNNNVAHYIGSIATASYLSGCLADIHFVDGQALTPSSFGEFDTNNVWQPKAYTGTYGTNGFHLDFADNSAATAAALGKDTSGNGNNWTPFNVQVTNGGPTSVAAASGALPIYNTTDTYGTVKGTGTRTDSNSSSIVLAIPMDGANNGTTFTDVSATIKGSGSAKTITRNGDTKTVTSVSKFYGSSAFFDGTGDFLQVTPRADFEPTGNTPFSFEAWIYPTTYGRTIFGTYYNTGSVGAGGEQGFLFILETDGKIYVPMRQSFSGGNVIPATTTTVPLNKWTHLAIQIGAQTDIYFDGILQPITVSYFGTTGPADGSRNPITSYNASATTYIGANNQTGTPFSFFAGYIQDLRVYNGVRKYTSNFNPPSSTLNPTIAAGNDSLVDSPTNYGTDDGLGGSVRGNYATWNPLANGAGVLSNGNLDLGNSNPDTRCNSTISVSSGKWYYEIRLNTLGTNSSAGIGQNQIRNAWPGNDALSYAYELDNARTAQSGNLVGYGSALTAGDIFMCAFDLDNSKIFFGKNGTWFNSSNPATGTNPAFTLAAGSYCPIGRPYGGGSFSLNAGQRPFAYTAPSGFKALCTANLPTPTIANPATVFDTKLYTGNGSTQTISGLNFSPDLVWIKTRSIGYFNVLYDTVRGAGTNKALYSNTTGAEGADTTIQNLTAFNSDGFSLGTTSSTNILNDSGNTRVAWCWDAGSSTVTNTQGSITSQVRANASAGFSIVTYTGGAANSTVGHGLGAAPHLIIAKSRFATGYPTSSWDVYHRSLGKDKFLYLERTDAVATYPNYWGSVEPTSTVFGVSELNFFNNRGNMVAYCFAPVAGYSSGFSYTGNGSTDGVFQFLGFRPRLILLKRTDTTGNWTLIDTAREGYNVDNDPLYPNLADAEGTADLLDITSNGFKLRSTDASVNANTGTYVGFAWAETPFAYSRAR